MGLCGSHQEPIVWNKLEHLPPRRNEGPVTVFVTIKPRTSFTIQVGCSRHTYNYNGLVGTELKIISHVTNVGEKYDELEPGMVPHFPYEGH